MSANRTLQDVANKPMMYQPAREDDFNELETFKDSNQPKFLPKNRKRNLNKIDAMEEDPYTAKNFITNPKVDRQNVPCCENNVYYYFGNFCDSTSVHGFKFLGERGRYWVEKIWWFFVVVFAFYGSSHLIYKSYQRWIESPVLVTFSTSETPIHKIPFPAVTICPEVKSDPVDFNYTSVYLKYRNNQTVTEDEATSYSFYSLFCDDSIDFDKSNRSLRISTEDFWILLLQSYLRVKTENCKWLGETNTECKYALTETLTSAGWCVSFNMVDDEDIYVVDSEQFDDNDLEKKSTIKQWSLEEGYADDNDMQAYPRRTTLAGLQTGFHIDLLVNEDEMDFVCSHFQGFKVVLHHPAEIPNMDKHFWVPLDQAVIATVKPRMIVTTDELKSYSVDVRKCYLPGERTLTAFKSYTQENCMAECTRNYTQQLCGCIGFHMAIDSRDNKTEYCGSGSRECMDIVKAHLLEIPQVLENEIGMSKLTECQCLPSCTSIEFDSEISQTNWNWKRTYDLREHNSEIQFSVERGHMSRLIVFYRNLQFMTSERHQLYTTVDFLANCGGLLGLFCGFSFTSLMEILYYLSLRFICNFKKFGRRVWSGAPELMEYN